MQERDLCSKTVLASDWEQDTATKLDHYLTAKATSRFFTGSVLVTRDGRDLLRRSCGFADVEHRIPNTPGTKFRLGSITKQFTAMVIMILQEQGKLNVQDTIGKHLSDVPTSWQSITIHQLLTHTSGLMHSWDLPGIQETMMVPSSLEQTLARFADRPLLSKPGERFYYSGLGYFVLAKIIQTVSGSPYGTVLQYHIFAPLGMNNTGEDRQATDSPQSGKWLHQRRRTGRERTPDRHASVDRWWESVLDRRRSVDVGPSVNGWPPHLEGLLRGDVHTREGELRLWLESMY